jgi:aminoglycoside 6'-N-acetyltransferase
MTEADFPLVAEWLQHPHVAEWWGEPRDAAGVAAKYGPRVRGESPTRMFVIELDGEPIGIVQTYRLRDYPDYEEATGVADAAGIDLFIGEPAALGRGLGPRIVERFARDVVFATFADVLRCVASPSVRNLRSQHVFETAGFSRLHTIDSPGEDEPEVVFVLDR